MNKMFFDSWDSVLRTTVITVLAYIILIIFLRVSGKRTLSKMNSFDFIVTIALGSTLATVTLNKNVMLFDGALAFFLLIMLQYIITYLSTRYKAVSNFVKPTPNMLVYKGQILTEAMRKERVVEEEIYAVVRQNGLSSLDEVAAIVLETDGSFTLIKNIKDMSEGTIKSVHKPNNLWEKI